MKIIEVEESADYLEKYIGKIKNGQQAVDRFIKFYETYKIKKQLEHKEEDMMLFQYGLYGWPGQEKEFHFDLTRQFEIPNEDEFLQLSFTLFYNTELIGDIQDYNSWSAYAENLVDWKAMIQNTEGFKKVKNIIPNRIEISLSQT